MIRHSRPSARFLAVASAFAIGGLPPLAAPARAATTDQQIAVAAAINAVLAGCTAALGAPRGMRLRAFGYGSAGGFVAATSLWSAKTYARRGGPYLVRALNAYGAGVVDGATRAGNPLVSALRGFAYPLGPGIVTLRDGVPSAYTADLTRLAALAGGLIAGRLDGERTLRLGVPVFRYGHGSIAELIENGEARHNSYGGLFNTIFLYDVGGVSQDGLLAHEFYHVLQDDRALLYTRGATWWKRDLVRVGSGFALRIDGSYLATEAAGLWISEMWLDHDRRPLEREANLFQDSSGERNALEPGPAAGAFSTAAGGESPAP